MRIPPARARGSAGRRAAAAFGWLLFFAIFLVALVASVAMTLLGRHGRVELHNAVDAAALAGAGAFADDVVLTGRADARDVLAAAARQRALALATHNRVRGQPPSLDRNDKNFIDSDVVLGGLGGAFSREFRVNGKGALDLYRPDLNAVRVAVRNGSAAAAATALADHDVLGFRAVPRAAAPPPDPPGPPAPPLRGLPLVPLAVLTDPRPPAQDDPAEWGGRRAGSWEREIMARLGQALDPEHDRYGYDPAARLPVDGADRIPEIVVRLGTGPDSDPVNGRVVRLGDATHPGDTAGDRQDLLRQVETGVLYEDLAYRDGRPTGGRLLLWDRERPPAPPAADENALALAEWAGALDADGDTDKPRTALLQSLGRILGAPRVWVLYSTVTDGPGGGRRATAVGFVAARLMHVKDAGADGVDLVLQPAVLHAGGAVTDAARRARGPRGLYNPTLARVRVVE